jgi:hypothetical protein
MLPDGTGPIVWGLVALALWGLCALPWLVL